MMTLPERPATLEALRAQLAAGALRESRHLEFKRELPDNRQLAKQVAGFAVAGGALVIGVAETDTGLEVSPVDCRGARERVEQVARDTPDPPVQIESYILEEGASGRGVLWIEIPASPDLLHQVGGAYYERGDTQTRPMRDADVAGRMALRVERPGPIREALARARQRAQPAAPSLHARTLVVARPIGAAKDEFYASTQQRKAWDAFATSVQAPGGALPPVPGRYWGRIGHALSPAPVTNLLIQYRDIEFEESGGFCSQSYGQVWWRGSEDAVYPKGAILACREAISLIAAVQRRTGQRRTGQRRVWDLAFEISCVGGRAVRLSDTDRHWMQDHVHDYRPRIPRDAYSSEVLGVSTQRLEQEARSVVEELAGRFLAECGLEFDEEWPSG